MYARLGLLDTIAELRLQQQARETRLAELCTDRERAHRTKLRLNEQCSQARAEIKGAVNVAMPPAFARELSDGTVDLRAVERWLRAAHAHDCVPATGVGLLTSRPAGEDSLLPEFELEAIADLTRAATR